jgi:hypothetical protein
MPWLLLVTSLSGNHGTLRLRFWRAVKAMGAAMLRDGVYVAPALAELRLGFEEQAAEIIASGGSAFILDVPEISERDRETVAALFDRTAIYQKLVETADDFMQNVGAMSEVEARRALRQATREFALIEATDFFPGRARELASAALVDAETALAARFSPEEPTPVHAVISRCSAKDYQGCTWATRRYLWVDRVTSAWLIKRFIDRQAGFFWLERAADCPPSAIGFDFDGAKFTHIEDYVTFEVLLRSFGLETDGALNRIATLVHQLDVGGGRVAEAAGFEAILSGARERCADDDALLDEMSGTLDNLYLAFSKAGATTRMEGS